jgi:hypothetical protein
MTFAAVPETGDTAVSLDCVLGCCAEDAQGSCLPRPSHSHHALVLEIVLPTVDADHKKVGEATVVNGFLERHSLCAGEE